jgi:hypothetical protein
MPAITLLTAAARRRVAGGGVGMRLVFQDEEAAGLDDESMAVGPRWG